MIEKKVLNIMNKEIDLLFNYPKSKRNLQERVNIKTEEIRKVARKFGKEFFDGDRKFGYGGFNYNPKYWINVIPDFVNEYNLKNGAKILDVGCAKGFMLYDFYKYNSTFDLYGLDISDYAIKNSIEGVKNKLTVGCASNLNFPDNFFDLVISINTVHNLEKEKCRIALQEIQRVTKSDSFVTVDAYRNEHEQKRMYEWNLTAKTIMSTDEWKLFFLDSGFKGDFYCFIP